MFIPNINLDESLIAKYQEEFAQSRCVFLPGLIHKAALNNLLKKIDQITFQTKYEQAEDNKFGKVLFVPQEQPVLFSFLLLFNNLNLFSLLERITGCVAIGNFVGRIHRSEGGEAHEIGWHDDNSDTRLLAMTLSLGDERYEGAKFQIRKKNSDHMLREFGQLEAGDAIIFEINPELEHRLTIVESGRRTVGVGWFRQQPDHRTFTKEYLIPF